MEKDQDLVPLMLLMIAVLPFSILLGAYIWGAVKMLLKEWFGKEIK